MNSDNKYMEEFVNIIKKYVDNGDIEINMETDLSELDIDSFKAVQILVDLEETFHIEFFDYELTLDLFENIGKLYEGFLKHVNNQ